MFKIKFFKGYFMRLVILFFMVMFFTVTSPSHLLAQDRPSAKNPFANLENINPELMNAGQKFARTYPDQNALEKAKKDFFETNIQRPNLSKLEESILLLEGSKLDVANSNYNAAIEKIATVAQYGALPSDRMLSTFQRLYTLAYGLGDFNLAAQAFSQATKLGHEARPRDQAMLAEIMLRANRNDLALARLSNAIEVFKSNGCPIEPKWQNIQTALEKSEMDFLNTLKANSAPFMFSPLTTLNLVPIKRAPANYPLKAEAKKIKGQVKMAMIIDNDGNTLCSYPVDAVVGDLSFVNAAQNSIENYKFDPKDLVSSTWVYGHEVVITFGNAQRGRRRR